MTPSEHFPYPLLKRVSRSFFLTLRVLPSGMREPIALAYLLARVADTIADTSAVTVSERQHLLTQLQVASARGVACEMTAISEHASTTDAELLRAFPSLIARLLATELKDRIAIQKVLSTITQGMAFDLRYFPNETSGKLSALATDHDLDQYTYWVAGCVGEFWTDVMLRHLPSLDALDHADLSRLGIRFGQALQLTNIVRDCPNDLRIGRCYLPQSLLAQHGLRPEDLQEEANTTAARPLFDAIIRRALTDFQAAIDYLTQLPRTQVRLRLACLLPIVIGLETLLAHVNLKQCLSSQQIAKVPRRQIYRIMLGAFFCVISNRAIRAWTHSLASNIRQRLKA